jgi:hypothetical protein
VPAGHGAQVILPLVLAWVPGGHGLQYADVLGSNESLKVPGGHAVQVTLPKPSL